MGAAPRFLIRLLLLTPLLVGLLCMISASTAAAAAAGSSQVVGCGRLSVALVEVWQAPNWYGSGYALFELSNRDTRDATVRLSLPSQPSGFALRTEKTVHVGAGKTTRVEMLVPAACNDFETWIDLTVNGTTCSGRDIGLRYLDPSVVYSPNERKALVGSNRLLSECLADTTSAFEPDQNDRANLQNHLALKTSPMSQWPTLRQAYDGFLVIALESEQWRSCPAEVKLALKDWVFAGGRLMIDGEVSAPEPWWTPVPGVKPPYPAYYHGLGAVSLPAYITGNRSQEPPWVMNLMSLSRNQMPWKQFGSESAQLTTNTKGLKRVLLLLLFGGSILMGPGAIFHLARKGKKYLILLVIPAVSLVLSALILVSTVIAEGRQRWSSFEGMVFIDQASQRAMTLGWWVFYASYPPRSMKFPAATQVALWGHVPKEYNYYSYSRTSGDTQRNFGTHPGHALIQTTDQSYTGTLRTRDSTAYHLRHVDAFAGRVRIIRTAAGVEAENSLGVALNFFLYTDGEGIEYTLEDLPANYRMRLVTKGPVKDHKGPIHLSDWFMAIQDPTIVPTPFAIEQHTPPYYLAKGIRGTWQGWTETVPTLKPPLPGATPTEASNLYVFGTVEEER